ncbi:MAG: SCO family protein [Anaerolineae bacterium]|nr:SCO family protein [Anaerolineae bacterium]
MTTPDKTKAHAPANRTAFWVLVIALLAGVALTGIAIMGSLSQALAPVTPTPQIEGITAIVPPDPLPDFTLTSSKGEPISLSDFAGRYVLLFFGYTHCPDFCPLTLAKEKLVHEQLGDMADQFAVVFISVDGERDTPEVLDDYLSRFDPSFVGMTGDEATIREIGVPYGLSFTLNKASPDDVDYSVDHSTLTYLIDPERRLHSLLSFSTEAPVIVDYLRMLATAG